MASSKTVIKEVIPFKGVSEINKKRMESPSAFVNELVKIRAENDNTGLPEFPSAQLWYSLNEDEIKEFKKIVEKYMIWDTYEKKMMAHFPLKKKKVIKYV